MCGFFGISDQIDQTLLERVGLALSHRGPDGEGVYIDDNVSLVHRRLSIIDPESGKQPIHNEKRDIWVVYNGEIYNYRELRADLIKQGHEFYTSTDTEVLVHLYEEYGEHCLEHLRGMFAFAIWDRQKRKLFLARDRFGIKPLYYFLNGSMLLFASEIKALLISGLVPRELNPQAVFYYLCLQAVPQPMTMIQGVQMLLPANCATFTHGRLSIKQYWDVPEPNYSSEMKESDYTDELLYRFEESVKLHLRSDVEVGAFLSGGVDSSAICAIAAKEINGLHTFSVGFDGEEAKYSELPFANMVAKQFGIQHNEIVLNDHTLSEELKRAVWAMDQPTIDGFNSYFVTQAAAQSLKVALSGLGGDELFCGYPRVRSFEIMTQHERRWEKYSGKWPKEYYRNLAEKLLQMSNGWFSETWQQRLRRLSLYGSVSKKVANLIGTLQYYGITEKEVGCFFTPNFRKHLLSTQSFSEFISSFVDDRFVNDPVQLFVKPELIPYMAYVLLRDTDAMSMSHSLEVRVPFLDHHFVEFALSVPSNLKQKSNTQKYILKKALESVLPHEILYRRKQGFNLPYGYWLKKNLRPMVEDVLSRESIVNRGIFKWSTVQKHKELFYNGTRNVHVVWLLFVLELWLQQYVDLCPSITPPQTKEIKTHGRVVGLC